MTLYAGCLKWSFLFTCVHYQADEIQSSNLVYHTWAADVWHTSLSGPKKRWPWAQTLVDIRYIDSERASTRTSLEIINLQLTIFTHHFSYLVSQIQRINPIQAGSALLTFMQLLVTYYQQQRQQQQQSRRAVPRSRVVDNSTFYIGSPSFDQTTTTTGNSTFYVPTRQEDPKPDSFP